MVKIYENFVLTLIVAWGKCRGVVVRERGGTLFRQIFWSQNSAPADIGHRWNANTSVLANHVVLVMLTLDQFIFWPKLPPSAGFGIKNLKKKFSGGDTPKPLNGRGRPSAALTPSMATCHAWRRKLPHCWDLGLGNRSPKSKFTTTHTPGKMTSQIDMQNSVKWCICDSVHTHELVYCGHSTSMLIYLSL